MIDSLFPYYGGKSRMAPQILAMLGATHSYIDPFFGSGAVLFAMPATPRRVIVNDLDGLLCNYWRAVAADPDRVAAYADYPVSELDKYARGCWLTDNRARIESLMADPAYYDPQIAAWWVWGISQHIGDGWAYKKHKEIPLMRSMGQGIHREAMRPAGALQRAMRGIAARLRHAVIACGDFERVLGPTALDAEGNKATAVFLDPPYDLAGRATVYAHDTDSAGRARDWAIANGDNPRLRIVLCGYDDSPMPPGWTLTRWKANGGYGNQGTGNGRANASRECLWASPHCVRAGLFDLIDI